MTQQIAATLLTVVCVTLRERCFARFSIRLPRLFAGSRMGLAYKWGRASNSLGIPYVQGNAAFVFRMDKKLPLGRILCQPRSIVDLVEVERKQQRKTYRRGITSRKNSGPW